ncbi:hypothetical protein [Haloglomus litoreum]|uniref:hypothetical protein n=1 Tax=Haloglomus litoreum TaxID=3034026 RepID=UPI0023E84A10|nr:hypothetical protein [Haloglomus sp. DT116]
MSDAGEAIKAVGALGLGGFIFIVIGGAIQESTTLTGSFIDFQLWGVVYLLAAVLLAIAAVVAVIQSLLP